MDANHGLIVKKIEEEVNNNFKSRLENQLVKKRFVVNASVISNFFGAINLYKKDNVHDFVEKFNLLVIKNHLPIQFVESIQLKCLVIQLCFHVVFPFKTTFNKEMLLDLVEKTNQTYVLLVLTKCVYATTNFDLEHMIFFIGCEFLEIRLDA